MGTAEGNGLDNLVFQNINLYFCKITIHG